MTALLLAALVIALVELEAADACQFMVSRPLVLGPVMGLAFHRLDFGAGLGALVELFSFEALPVGSSLPINATVAAGGALLLALGPSPVPPELAFPAGLSLGWLFSRVEVLLRRRRARFDGLARSLAEHLAATSLFLLAVVLVLRPLLLAAWGGVPAPLAAGLAAGLRFAPWLGAAALARALWPR